MAYRASRPGGDSVTVCDYTGFMIHKGDCVSQDQCNGQGTFPTGLRVHCSVADEPNPQGLLPPICHDPHPVLDVIRDTQGLDNPFAPVMEVDLVEGPFEFPDIPQVQEMVFVDRSGAVPAGVVFLFLPAFFQMRMTNRAGVSVRLGMMGNPAAFFDLGAGASFLLTCNTWDWTVTPVPV